MTDKNENKRRQNLSQSHMPEKSVLYDKIVPAALIGLSVIMVVVVIVVIGIVIGLIPA